VTTGSAAAAKSSGVIVPYDISVPSCQGDDYGYVAVVTAIHHQLAFAVQGKIVWRISP
jgi:hypothetical protein